MAFALDIPELREQVSAHLNMKDMFACSLISRLWYTSFNADIWRTVAVASTYKKNSPVSALIKNAHHVREFRLSGMVSMDHFSPGCTKLRVLTIDGDMIANADKNNSKALETIVTDISTRIAEIIEQNRFLQHFQYYDQRLKPTGSIWKALAGCPVISSLQICRSTVRPEDMPTFWDACSKLETLHIHDCSFSDYENSSNKPTVQFRKLQTVWMINVKDWSPLHQLHLIGQAPELRSWHLDVARDDIEDEDMAVALDNMPLAVSLVAHWTRFGPLAFRSLQAHRHCITIKTLDLYRCAYVTSHMVQTLLSTCPLLESFAADLILGSDIVDGEPWVCLNLTSLLVHLSLNGTIPEESQSMTQAEARSREQQRACEQLKSLDFRLRKKGGVLEDLGDMNKLESLNFHATGQQLDVEDLQWMYDHWPRLLFVMGQFHSDEARQRVVMEAYLEQRRKIVPLSRRLF
ncbi:hypothetical protein BG006_009062 [Podila minutissima]|uniref:F-box domain-containing protein n=1 Tax=Podila minutissima TaxID=64525 RepID=A0A9P5SU86_9FUNG|nr:hypothetical protein BG006_009062 [Podila minutissima]